MQIKSMFGSEMKFLKFLLENNYVWYSWSI